MAARQYEEEDEFDDTWYEDSIWNPEPEVEEDPILIDRTANSLPVKSLGLTPSQFTEFAFRMPRPPVEKETQDTYERRMKEIVDRGEDPLYEQFSFTERRYMRRIYDTPARRILLMCARQCEKSTLLGNVSLCYMGLVPSYKLLYVNSSATQAKVFSNDRVKEPIETSLILKRFTTKMLSSNIFEKQFVNRSKVTIRYAFLNADRVRGIPAYGLCMDEFQDIIADNIPVIEQCQAHAPPQYIRRWYAGTPKSLDNNIETFWETRSTQNQWVVPHDCKMGEGGRYWNILGEQNIGKKGLICANCKKLLDPMTEDAQWASMQEMRVDREGNPTGDITFEGYRIPQLMVPWKKWSEILSDYNAYPRDKFYNEVLGISYDSGTRPLTKAQVIVNCRSNIRLSDVEDYRQFAYDRTIFAGVDHGTGENSFTVITLGMYVEMKFRVFYWHRFEGEETIPEVTLAKIDELINYFNVKVIGADYGGGFDRNDHLVRKFGPTSVAKFQYMARAKRKVEYDQKLGRYKVARTEVMSDIFNAIKRGNVFEFPCVEDFMKPFGQDMLNIYSEFNDKIQMIKYDHRQGNTDDSFHSLLYCFLASMIVHKRPDIITPRREIDGRPTQEWKGPQWQG